MNKAEGGVYLGEPRIDRIGNYFWPCKDPELRTLVGERCPYTGDALITGGVKVISPEPKCLRCVAQIIQKRFH